MPLIVIFIVIFILVENGSGKHLRKYDKQLDLWKILHDSHHQAQFHLKQ